MFSVDPTKSAKGARKMNEEEARKMFERLRRAADGYAKGEVVLPLGDLPRQFRLPKCTAVSLMNYPPNRMDLLLDTDIGDHRFVIELDPKATEALCRLLALSAKGPDGKHKR
jgi:hypothetical protein